MSSPYRLLDPASLASISPAQLNPIYQPQSGYINKLKLQQKEVIASLAQIRNRQQQKLLTSSQQQLRK